MKKFVTTDNQARLTEDQTYSVSEFLALFTGAQGPVLTGPDGFISNTLLNPATPFSLADSAKEISMDVVLGEDIPALRMIYISAGLAFKGSHVTKPEATIAGILKTGGTTGTTRKCLILGRIDDPFFTLGSNIPFYLTTDGQVSATAPTTGFLKECGQSLGTGSIFINIKTTITLA